MRTHKIMAAWDGISADTCAQAKCLLSFRLKIPGNTFFMHTHTHTHTHTYTHMHTYTYTEDEARAGRSLSDNDCCEHAQVAWAFPSGDLLLLAPYEADQVRCGDVSVLRVLCELFVCMVMWTRASVCVCDPRTYVPGS
jgi:hypothetical protein